LNESRGDYPFVRRVGIVFSRRGKEEHRKEKILTIRYFNTQKEIYILPKGKKENEGRKKKGGKDDIMLPGRLICNRKDQNFQRGDCFWALGGGSS